ncbi:MAG: hypothetical protein ACRCVV_03935 [Shewanella sp.]
MEARFSLLATHRATHSYFQRRDLRRYSSALIDLLFASKNALANARRNNNSLTHRQNLSMDKHRLFPNCPNRENDKIHSSDIAHRQALHDLTVEEVHLAKMLPSSSYGMTTTKNIFTSLLSLKPLTFQHSQLDEIYLLQQTEIRQRAAQVESQLTLLKRYLKDAPDEARYFLDKLLTESVLLGEKIGEYNERIDALQPMRNDRKYTEARKAGAQKKCQQYQQPLKLLVSDIVAMIEGSMKFKHAPKSTLANVIIKMVSAKRQDCLSEYTIKKYIQQCRTIRPTGGRPSTTSPTESELSTWLESHFANKIDAYFINR